MFKKKIKVKAKNALCIPQQAHPSEWFDLAASEDVHLSPGEFKYIDLGVCIEVPEGYEAIMAPRSSTFKKYGILQTNSIGVIDHAYAGPDDWWKFPAYATQHIDILKGTRIAQFRIQKVQPYAVIDLVDEMTNTNRGGLGSTGV